MIHFRSFSAEDWIEFQKITKEAFAREGITKEGYLQTIENEGFVGTFVEGKLVGYLWLMTHREYGHLGQIAVTKLERVKGYGNKLMERALAYFKDKNMERVGLYVETKNNVAINLYEKYGFVKQFESWNFWIEEDHFLKMEELSQKNENAELRILTTQDYETVVNTFPATNKEELKSHLTDEQSVGFTGVESIPLGLFVDNKLQIYGRFNPEFPGCRPFLVLDTEYFEEFIARLKPHKRKDFIRLTFDGDSKLAKFFQERGYILWHHLWFMQRENREK